MNKLLLISSFLILTVFSAVHAQEVKTEFEIVKSILGKEKRFYIIEHMGLTEEQEKVFWPIYEDYEIDRARFSRKRIDLLRKYVENYGNISSGAVDDFANSIIKFQKKEYKLNRKYYRLMSSKLTNAIAARFIQIEEYINASIKLEILKELPFAKK